MEGAEGMLHSSCIQDHNRALLQKGVVLPRKAIEQLSEKFLAPDESFLPRAKKTMRSDVFECGLRSLCVHPSLPASGKLHRMVMLDVRQYWYPCHRYCVKQLEAERVARARSPSRTTNHKVRRMIRFRVHMHLI